MFRTAYINGTYVSYTQAMVHIEDRGYQFADGVYEVIGIREGQLIDSVRHYDRLEYSLTELRITPPMSRSALSFIISQVIQRNRVTNGYIYLQITRGVAPRNHAFPRIAKPSLVITAKKTKPFNAEVMGKEVNVITVPDIRWQRCDIKSISLLPNVLAKQKAFEAAAFDSWMVDKDGFITEGSASNAWIVTTNGTLVTRNADHDILNGVTRLGVLDIVQEQNIPFEERPFAPDEVKQAREAFLTSTTNWIRPVTAIDGQTIGNGKVGPLTIHLLQAYNEIFSA